MTRRARRRVAVVAQVAVVPALVALALVVGASGAAAEPTATQAGAPACDCHRFADDLEAARAVYASRGEGATSPPSQAARARFRERILDAHARASCLVACAGIADAERDQARVLLATTAFKSRRFGPTDAAAAARMARGLEESERCQAHTPHPPACDLWHGSIRGIQASGSWNPMQLGLPKQLLAEFRAARAGAAPGADPPNGAATRAEASVLMRAPSVAGGNLEAAHQLMEAAAAAPIFACTVDNRELLAQTRARTGDSPGAVAELRAALAAGLPTCGDNRYENASDLEEAARCLARLEEHPDADPGWDDDCP